MINVSSEWLNAHKQRLLPESFLEIKLDVTDEDVPSLVSVNSSNAAVFSNGANMVGGLTQPVPSGYATLEHNRWALDGTKKLVPETAPYDTPGFVSFDGSGLQLTIKLAERRAVGVPGLTITWDSEYGEYATYYAVDVYRGAERIMDYTINGNTESVTEIPIAFSDYDRVEILVREWSEPDHRARIDRVCFGFGLILEKADVLNYTHEQSGCLNSSELPKNSVDFTLNNMNGIWNPSNPVGLGQYLSERQAVTIRYGLDVNGAKEWISAGKFYLSQWEAQEDGYGAKFVARDILEFLLNEPYTGPASGTLYELATEALSGANPPKEFSYILDPSLGWYSATVTEKYTVAEILQMCANAASCVLWQDRNGVLRIEPLNKNQSDYIVSTNFSYKHPRVELTKPLKAVSVAYGDEQEYLLSVENTGETQTVENPLVSTAAQASILADWVRNTLRTRKVVSGEFRADPRLDVFDIVAVESKYGLITPVAITEITYTYNGAMKANYLGRVISDVSDVAMFVLNESVLDEGVL